MQPQVVRLCPTGSAMTFPWRTWTFFMPSGTSICEFHMHGWASSTHKYDSPSFAQLPLVHRHLEYYSIVPIKSMVSEWNTGLDPTQWFGRGPVLCPKQNFSLSWHSGHVHWLESANFFLLWTTLPFFICEAYSHLTLAQFDEPFASTSEHMLPGEQTNVWGPKNMYVVQSYLSLLLLFSLHPKDILLFQNADRQYWAPLKVLSHDNF